MKKTIYRVSLFKGANSMCEQVALKALQFNGGQNRCSISDLKTMAEGYKMLYPSISENATIEVLSDHLLHVDTKIGDDYKTVLIIEQVEIVELATLENVVQQRNRPFNPIVETDLN